MSRKNGHHFADDILKCISLHENFRLSTKISLKYVPYGLIDNMAALFQIMAWGRTGDKPLSEAMMAEFTDVYTCTSLGLNELIGRVKLVTLP